MIGLTVTFAPIVTAVMGVTVKMIYIIKAVTGVTPVTTAASFSGVQGGFFKNLPCREDDRSRRGHSPDRKRYSAPTGREYPQR